MRFKVGVRDLEGLFMGNACAKQKRVWALDLKQVFRRLYGPP